jgi:WD40 repeat protein
VLSIAAVESKATFATRWEMNLGDYVMRLAWSPKGDVLAAACVGGGVHILSETQGVISLEGHEHGAHCVSWSHDGQYVASGGQDGQVKIWNAASGELLHSMHAGSAWVERVAFAPAAPLLVSAAGRQLKLWNVQGECVREYPVHPSTISDIQWQPGAEFLTSACYGQLATFNTKSAEPVKAFRWKGSILTVAWSPDGNYVATGNQDASVHFWYRKSGKDLEMSGYPAKVRELAWDAGSRYLATGGGSSIAVWDCGGKGPAGTRPIELQQHEVLISALEYRPHGELLASGCEGGRVCLWRPGKDALPLQTLDIDASVTQVRWAPNGKTLAVSSASGLVRGLSAV